VNPPSKAVFVPPRPNLGPEPFVERPNYTAAIVAGVFVFTAIVAWRIRRWKTRRAKIAPPDGTVVATPETPRDQMIALSTTLRARLASRFGPGWLAKTTEEIAADPALSQLLAPEQLERLGILLREADHAKFADSAAMRELAVFTAYLEELAALAGTLEPAAGAKSKTIGK
jgi:hypothetical protein